LGWLPEAVPWDVALAFIVTTSLFGDGASTMTGDGIGFLDNAAAIIFVTQLISQLLHWLVG
jgi:hypothetical protein